MSKGYEYLTAEQATILDGFPVLSADDLNTANNMFTHYVFYERNKTGWTISTSCCHQTERDYPFLQRTEAPSHYEFIQSNHNDTVVCPYCGKRATLKCIGRIKNRTRLTEYVPITFLHAKDGELYAQCYWGRKIYDNQSFRGEPQYMVTNVYHFTPGKATMFEACYSNEWKAHIDEGRLNPAKRQVTEPFTEGSGMMWHYARYGVINTEAIKDTFLRYCQYMELYYRPRHTTHMNLMRYLTLACLYPSAVEMLMKNGLNRLVDDIIENRKKNADIFKWEESNPQKAFGLSGSELREFIESGKDYEILRLYKKLRKTNVSAGFAEIGGYRKEFGKETAAFVMYCGKYKIKPLKLYNWLLKDTGPMCGGMGIRTVQCVFKDWKDYIDAAAVIGYDLTVERVLLPKQFWEAHDNATKELSRRLNTLNVTSTKKAIEKAYQRYFYVADGFIIRPAANAEEIVAEGNALSHCVGGYAERHMTGKLTICFMRKATEPDKPLFTIEMDTDGKLRQIQGYKNSTYAIRKDFGFVLTPWLEWINAGSKRDKEGLPIMKKTRKKKEVTAA